MKLLVDTNVLLRVARRDDAQHPLVLGDLDDRVRAGFELCVCAQSFFELWVVLTRPEKANGLGRTSAEARAQIDTLRRMFTLPDPAELLQEWLELCTRYAVTGKPAHDARFVALMLGHGITHLLTLNGGDFRRYAEVTVVAPGEGA